MSKFREFDPFNPIPRRAPTLAQTALRAVQVAGALMVGVFLFDTYARVATGGGLGGPPLVQPAQTRMASAERVEAQRALWRVAAARYASEQAPVMTAELRTIVPTEVVDASPLWGPPPAD